MHTVVPEVPISFVSNMTSRFDLYLNTNAAVLKLHMYGCCGRNPEVPDSHVDSGSQVAVLWLLFLILIINDKASFEAAT